MKVIEGVALRDLDIIVYPALAAHLGESEGCTHFHDGLLEILILAPYWDSFIHGGSDRNRAITTLAHELGHAVLHRRELRALAGCDRSAVEASRALHRRRELKAFYDPEWQAWAFAGAVLMPRPALRRMSGATISEIASEFRVSTSMVRTHVKRIPRLGFAFGKGGRLEVAG